jgi:putative tryptophan/tyrosine transport system substrate-binding protein
LPQVVANRRIALKRLLLLALAAAGSASGARGGWVAFIAPDIPQTRKLFEEFRRRASSVLSADGIEARFIGMTAVDPDNRRKVEETVAHQPRAIIAASARDALYAKAHTTSIPILFASVADPVRIGLVASLAAPGGNLTGFTYDIPVEGKQFELLVEIAPQAQVLGVLEDGHWIGERITKEKLADYRARLGKEIRVFQAASVQELSRIVLSSKDVDAWLVPIGNVAAEGRAELVRAMREAKRPAVYGRTFFVEAGGLASYQEMIPDPVEIWVTMLQSVLKGIAPSRIPVQRPKQFEMALNIDEARLIGISLPADLLRRANKVLPR